MGSSCGRRGLHIHSKVTARGGASTLTFFILLINDWTHAGLCGASLHQQTVAVSLEVDSSVNSHYPTLACHDDIGLYWTASEQHKDPVVPAYIPQWSVAYSHGEIQTMSHIVDLCSLPTWTVVCCNYILPMKMLSAGWRHSTHITINTKIVHFLYCLLGIKSIRLAKLKQ